jgi:PII-like signaling protein
LKDILVFFVLSEVLEKREIICFIGIDLSLDLPLVIEFFDTNDKVQFILEHLGKKIKPEHIVFWEAKVNT